MECHKRNSIEEYEQVNLEPDKYHNHKNVMHINLRRVCL